jgi:hypothetical protein
MNAPSTIAPAAKDTFLSLDGSTTVEVRHASHPEAVRSMTPIGCTVIFWSSRCFARTR